jgi:tetratricopeptide (TPR) repeat protein
MVLPAKAASQFMQLAQAQAAAPTQAQAPAGESAQSTDPLLQAQVLITQKRNDEARAILLELEKQPTSDQARANQVLFLLGLLDLDSKNYNSAIERFRRILVSEPNAVRVRLELGRAFFLQGRYSDAQRQFLYARAGDLPPEVLANIDNFLMLIRQQKTFSYSLAFAITPDSNLNAGPATSTVSLYGLPFQLSSDAKAKSGVGLSLAGNVEWTPRIDDTMKWRLGTQLNRSQYAKTEFDDMTLALYSGPHLTLQNWDFNLLGNFSRRWYGDSDYALSYGSSADATYYINTRLGVGLSLALSQTNYDHDSLENGLGKSVGVNVSYTLTSASFVQGAVVVGQQDAGIRAYAFDTKRFALSYTQDFAGGFTASLAPTYTMINYDEPLAAFSETRRDRQYSIQVSLLNRRFDFHGFTPRIAYTFIQNASNIDLYRFQRNRLEIGLTSSF